MKLKLKETLAKLIKAVRPATCTAVSLPFTPPCNGLLIGLIRAGAQGRCYALFTNAEPNIIDCYQTSGGYCVGAVFVTKNRKVEQNGSSNLESTYYYFVPLVGGVLRNPVVSRLTAFFTSLLFGGDVDEGHSQKAVGEGAFVLFRHKNKRELGISRISEWACRGLVLWGKCTLQRSKYNDSSTAHNTPNVFSDCRRNTQRICTSSVEQSLVLRKLAEYIHIIHRRDRLDHGSLIDSRGIQEVAISERRWAA